MSANWAKSILDAGGPVLKGLIEKGVGGGLKGAIAGKIADAALSGLAEALGTDATPEAVGDAIERDPVRAAPIVQYVESQLVSTLEIGSGDLTQYIGLLQGDQSSEGVLSRIWRPLFALVFVGVYAMVMVTICWLLWTRQLATLTNLGEITTFLTFGFVAGCAVLGVQIWQKAKTEQQGS